MRRVAHCLMFACLSGGVALAVPEPDAISIGGFVCEGTTTPGFAIGQQKGPVGCDKPLAGALIRFQADSAQNDEIGLVSSGSDGAFRVGPVSTESDRRYCLSVAASRHQGVQICLPHALFAQLADRSLRIALTPGGFPDSNPIAVYRERPGQSTVPQSSDALELTTPWAIGGRALAQSLQPAYDTFEARDIDNRTWTAAALKGRVALVVFWALGCGPCRKELPLLKQIYAAHHADGLEIIGISQDAERAEQFKQFIAHNGVTWPQVLVRDHEDPLIKAFHVDAIPAVFLVDRRGQVQEGRLYEPDLESRVSSLLHGKGTAAGGVPRSARRQ